MIRANKSFKNFWERNRLTQGYLLKRTVGRAMFRFARAIMLFGLCFLILQPILSKMSVSFMEEKDLYDATIINIPRNWSTQNYQMSSYLMNYKKALGTTLWLSLIIALIQLASTTLVAYGFARYNFPGKKLLFAFVLLSIVIPPQTILTALYLNFRYFDIFGIFKLFTGDTVNLLNSVWPYVFISSGAMGLKNGLYIFMLRQYFRGIPKEMEEAAYVDGCGKLKTFLVIMLPDAKPMLTSIFLFAYVWQWTDSFYSSLFLRKISPRNAGKTFCMVCWRAARSLYLSCATTCKKAIRPITILKMPSMMIKTTVMRLCDTDGVLADRVFVYRIRPIAAHYC